MCRSVATAPSVSTPAASSLARHYRTLVDESDEDDLRVSWIILIVREMRELHNISLSLCSRVPPRSSGRTVQTVGGGTKRSRKPGRLLCVVLLSTTRCLLRLSGQ